MRNIAEYQLCNIIQCTWLYHLNSQYDKRRCKCLPGIPAGRENPDLIHVWRNAYWPASDEGTEIPSPKKKRNSGSNISWSCGSDMDSCHRTLHRIHGIHLQECYWILRYQASYHPWEDAYLLRILFQRQSETGMVWRWRLVQRRKRSRRMVYHQDDRIRLCLCPSA